MRILFTPQIPLDGDSIKYTFDGDIIDVKVTYQGMIYRDTFDFSNVPDGEMKMYDENGNEAVQTELPISVLLGAKRVNGELKVELLNWIDSDASEEERFPKWVDSSEIIKKDMQDDKVEIEKEKISTEGWDEF